MEIISSELVQMGQNKINGIQQTMSTDRPFRHVFMVYGCPTDNACREFVQENLCENGFSTRQNFLSMKMIPNLG